MTLSQGPKHNSELDQIHAYMSLMGAEFLSYEEHETDSLEGASFSYQDTVEILDPANSVEWRTYTTSGTDTVIFAYGNMTCEPSTEQEDNGSNGGNGSTTGTLVGNNGNGGGDTETGSTETTDSNDGSGDASQGTDNNNGEDTTPTPLAFTPATTTPGEADDTEVLGEQIEAEDEPTEENLLEDLEDPSQENTDQDNKDYLYGIFAAIAGLLFLFFAFKKRDEEEEDAS